MGGTIQQVQTAKADCCAGMALYGTVTAATRSAAVSRNTHYIWMRADAEYVAAFAQATAEYADRLESEMYRRAVEGVDEPWTLDRDGRPLMRRRYSDTLLIVALKGALGNKYKDNQGTTLHVGDTNVLIAADTLIAAALAARASQ